ncbi:MAG: bifunctional ADP-heptose synthase [Bacteroidota bacterium]|nr:bifunctional ADP-heptose synthase [Bacteroidota bacterium]
MISKEEIKQVRKKAGTIKAVVIGDTMLDRYIYGSVDRISPEAPVPVLSHKSTVTKAGGAANVAMNLAAWGCQTTLFGLTGKDSHLAVLKALLNEKSIRHHLVESDDRPTTIKTRVVASTHHLLRIDEESSVYLNGFHEQAALTYVENQLSGENIDLIILQDYNKGFLTPSMIRLIIDIGRAKKAFIAVDPKEKNFLDFTDINLLKPNLREASQAAKRGLGVSDLSSVADEWRINQRIDTVAITLGGHGIFLENQQGVVHVVPEKSIDVVDVCGAGDAVVCSLALSLMTGLNLEKTGFLGNLSGAYVCSHSGVVSVDPLAIMEELRG